MKFYSFLKIIFLLVCSLYVASCKQKEVKCSQSIIHTDPNFNISIHENAPFKDFPKKVVVFDIPIYASLCVEDVKLLHAANVMAQYLDNDEDGVVDNKDVLNAMHVNHAFMVMWYEESDLEGVDLMPGVIGQDLGNDETNPSYVVEGKVGAFDASLEEVLHIITHAGYAYAYPDVFGEYEGTALAKAMDIARGGYFVEVPSAYPEESWYSYDDETCDYSCMATEYIYWGMTSILGAQENRANRIQDEWRLHTKELVQQADTAIYGLLTDPQYKFPQILPDGRYRRER